MTIYDINIKDKLFCNKILEDVEDEVNTWIEDNDGIWVRNINLYTAISSDDQIEYCINILYDVSPI